MLALTSSHGQKDFSSLLHGRNLSLRMSEICSVRKGWTFVGNLECVDIGDSFIGIDKDIYLYGNWHQRTIESFFRRHVRNAFY